MDEKKESQKEEREMQNPHEKADPAEQKIEDTTLIAKIRTNPWMASTFFLGVVCLILIIGSFTGGMTGHAISADEAGQQLLDFYTAYGAEGLTLDSVDEISGVYQVNFEYDGSIVPIFVTKDGKYAGSLSPLSTDDSSSDNSDSIPTEVPKSDRPKVELFVWGYCPYGVQAQGPFTEVAKLLKNSADFKVVPYYDGHGEFETQENKVELCIQELFPEKYWDYSERFVTDIYPVCSQTRDVACDESESTTLMNSVGIDSAAVWNCVNTQGDALYNEARSRAQDLGVTGSPTIVINDAIASPSSRTADAFKISVCEAYNTAPSDCDTALSTDAGTASGSC